VLPDILSGNIIGIVAQRLVRQLCPHCREPHELDASTRKLLGVDDVWKGNVYRASGCEQCENQGYKGRVAIMEIFKIDHEIDELIARRATARELRETARRTGYHTLAEDAIARVLAGQTSLEEISRIVDLTDRVA